MKFIQWLIYSSANPQNFSLTMKALIPFLVLFNVSDATSLGEVADTMVNALVLTGTWVAGLITAYGAVRKLWITYYSK